MNRQRKTHLTNRFNPRARRTAAPPAQLHAMPRLIAHRGGATSAPENTLAAIKQAAANGADGVEIDVRVTSDGVAVLMHDPTLARTTNGKGKVTNTTLAELRRLDAGSWYGPAFQGEKVPTLAEALKLCAGLGMDVVIDIKPAKGRAGADTEIILNNARKAWPSTRTPPTLHSENVSVLATAMKIMPDWPRAIVFRRPFLSWKSRLAVADTLSVGTRVMGTGWVQSIARLARRHNKGLSVWTVNNPQNALRLAHMGAETIFTDAPAALRVALKRALRYPVSPGRKSGPRTPS